MRVKKRQKFASCLAIFHTHTHTLLLVVCPQHSRAQSFSSSLSWHTYSHNKYSLGPCRKKKLKARFQLYCPYQTVLTLVSTGTEPNESLGSRSSLFQGSSVDLPFNSVKPLFHEFVVHILNTHYLQKGSCSRTTATKFPVSLSCYTS